MERRAAGGEMKFKDPKMQELFDKMLDQWSHQSHAINEIHNSTFEKEKYYFKFRRLMDQFYIDRDTFVEYVESKLKEER
jgi:hypothetical protein